MKGINTPGQSLERGGVASYSAPRGEVSQLAFPAFAQQCDHVVVPLPSLRWKLKRFTLIILVLLISVSFAFAEDFGAGVSIGGNLAFLSTEGTLDTLLDDRSPRLGLTAGVYGDYEFHSVKDKLHLSVQPGIFYTMKGFRLDDFKVNLDYIEIPVLVKASMPIDAPMDPYLLIGPSLGINVVRESEIAGYFASSDDKRADFGIVIGAGIDLEMDIAVDIRANFGMVNIIDSDIRNQNHSVALMVSYKLM